LPMHSKSNFLNSPTKNTKPTLRRATRRDLPAMLDIIAQTFAKEDAATAKGELIAIMKGASCEHIFLVAFIDGAMVGLAGLVQSWLDFNAYEILWVGVRPGLQGLGVGQTIIKELLKQAGSIKGRSAVRTILLSTEAVGFFKKCGFTSIAPLTTGGDLMMMNIGKGRSR
jgi:N-acetylglutamate synthase-like GNAT family acetyltransferase